MDKRRIDAIVSEYETRLSLYTDFGTHAQGLIKNKLAKAGVAIHHITNRVKDPVSLRRKIKRKNYTALEDITDLVGIRIITLFVDGIDDVAAVLPAFFEIDDTRSVDRREAESSERFGYQSLHRIASFNKDREKLDEYKDFAGLFCEIQIRSVLQHAWAEIEHDLGYKNEAAGPDDLRRRFSRISALLEVADDEFVRLRRQVERATAADVIEASPATAEITPVSLGVLLSSDPVALELLKQLEKIFGTPPSELDISSLNERVRELLYLGINSVEKLRDALAAHQQVIPKFAQRFFGRTFGANWTSSFLLFLCVQVLAARRPRTEEEAVATFTQLEIAAPPERRRYVREIRGFLDSAGGEPNN
ncbi:MAG TPA: hypothetical protein VF584_13765 [Longimicrobium sp.]|jgi:ppGpp synthetase/RelA/SpoT-type nucleotidyltranferase